MSPNKLLLMIIVVLVGACLMDVLVNWLNIRSLTLRIPIEFQGYYDAARYQASQDYLCANTRLAMVKTIALTVLVVGFILAGGFAMTDRAARYFQAGPIVTGMIFAVILAGPLFLIQLSFSAYHVFVIEEGFGFNRMTVGTFLLDQLKSATLAVVFGGLAFALVL